MAQQKIGCPQSPKRRNGVFQKRHVVDGAPLLCAAVDRVPQKGIGLVYLQTQRAFGMAGRNGKKWSTGCRLKWSWACGPPCRTRSFYRYSVPDKGLPSPAYPDCSYGRDENGRAPHRAFAATPAAAPTLERRRPHRTATDGLFPGSGQCQPKGDLPWTSDTGYCCPKTANRASTSPPKNKKASVHLWDESHASAVPPAFPAMPGTPDR